MVLLEMTLRSDEQIAEHPTLLTAYTDRQIQTVTVGMHPQFGVGYPETCDHCDQSHHFTSYFWGAFR